MEQLQHIWTEHGGWILTYLLTGIMLTAIWRMAIWRTGADSRVFFGFGQQLAQALLPNQPGAWASFVGAWVTVGLTVYCALAFHLPPTVEEWWQLAINLGMAAGLFVLSLPASLPPSEPIYPKGTIAVTNQREEGLR